MTIELTKEESTKWERNEGDEDTNGIKTRRK
jgi:hypothetical protein